MGSRNFYVPSTSAGSKLSSDSGQYRTGAKPSRPNCNRCSSCIMISNISEFADESTPLVASSVHSHWSSPWLDKVLMAALILLFLCGTAFGVYLLFAQCQGAVIEEFDLVPGEAWGVNASFLQQLPLLRHPLSKVLLLRLSSSCSAPGGCLDYQNVKKLLTWDGRVAYNFYQDGSGRLFEGRGFLFQAQCHLADCDGVLTVAILEQQNTPPSTRQLPKLKAFLDYAVMDQKLTTCYEVLAKHDFDDMAFVLKKMLKDEGSCKYYY